MEYPHGFLLDFLYFASLPSPPPPPLSLFPKTVCVVHQLTLGSDIRFFSLDAVVGLEFDVWIEKSMFHSGGERRRRPSERQRQIDTFRSHFLHCLPLSTAFFHRYVFSSTTPLSSLISTQFMSHHSEVEVVLTTSLQDLGFSPSLSLAFSLYQVFIF